MKRVHWVITRFSLPSAIFGLFLSICLLLMPIIPIQLQTVMTNAIFIGIPISLVLTSLSLIPLIICLRKYE